MAAVAWPPPAGRFFAAADEVLDAERQRIDAKLARDLSVFR